METPRSVVGETSFVISAVSFLSPILSPSFSSQKKRKQKERERDWKGWSWLSSSSSSLFINLSIFLFFSPPLLLFSLSPYSLDFSSVRSFRAQRSLVDRGATLSPSSMVALVERESRRRVEGGKKGNKKTQGIRRRGLVCLSWQKCVRMSGGCYDGSV